MGIPRLMTQVSPYGESVTWHKGDTPPVVKENLIIDGPSFCYFIHHRCLSTKTRARHALEAVPTYPELAEEAIAWLDELETFGFCINYIFFDGFLPPSKSSTRHDRLEKNLLQLRSFRSSHSTTALSSPNTSTNSSGSSRPKPASTSISTPPHLPARLSALPAAPFLVPTILSILQHSRYSYATRTVPCEADVACISALPPASNDIILTNDSDLLVLAPTGRVIFFGDLAFGTLHTQQDTMTGVSYSPPTLAAALSLNLSSDDMLKLAFWMTRDSALGIKECAKLAISSRERFADGHVAGKYALFKEAYTSAAQFSAYACGVEEVSGKTQKYARLQKSLDGLDPRVSEVVQQWLSTMWPDGHFIPRATRQIQTFLPFLFDDPTRASAWRTSGHIRRLAYSILALHGPPFTLSECDRRGERMVGVDVSLLSNQDVLAESRALLSSITDVLPTPRNHNRNTLSDNEGIVDATPTPSAWHLYLLTSVLRCIATSSTAPPSRQQILHFATSSGSAYAWPHVHLSAQCEGTFYSLRILGQILDVALCGDIPVREGKEGEVGPEVVQVLKNLSRVLTTLPNVEDVFGQAGAGFRDGLWGAQEIKALEGVMDVVLGREETREEGGSTKHRGKKRKGRKGADGTAEVGVGVKIGAVGGGGGSPVNMFELLGDDT